MLLDYFGIHSTQYHHNEVNPPPYRRISFAFRKICCLSVDETSFPMYMADVVSTVSLSVSSSLGSVLCFSNNCFLIQCFFCWSSTVHILGKIESREEPGRNNLQFLAILWSISLAVSKPKFTLLPL